MLLPLIVLFSCVNGDTAIIAGGGPGAIMTAMRLSELRPSWSITIVEASDFTLDEYYDAGYGNSSAWFAASQDPRLRYSTKYAPAIPGKGLGGGTLHFGLQFINQPEVIANSEGYEGWQKYFEALTDRLEPVAYSYENNEGPNFAWTQIRKALGDSSEFDTYNNDLYASGKGFSSRLVLGKLLDNYSNIQVVYSTKIVRLQLDGNTATGVIDSEGTVHAADHVFLAAGAIETPLILQRSGVSAGTKLYDHAGFTQLFMPPNTTYASPVSPDVTAATLDGKIPIIEDLASLNTVPDRVVAAFQHSQINTNQADELMSGDSVSNPEDIIFGDSGFHYVYDLGEWFWYGHPAGNKRANFEANNWMGNPVLIEHHGLEGAAGRIQNAGGKLIGLYVAPSVTPVYDPKWFLATGSDGSDVISHLQTRSSDFTWQTYLSVVKPYDPFLLCTYAQARDLSGAGSIKSLDEDNQEIKLNHFGEPGSEFEERSVNDLLGAVDKMQRALGSIGYVPTSAVTRETVLAASTIYHYMGSALDAIDDKGKVVGMSNVYVTDAAALPGPFAGSTSVPVMAGALRTVEMNFGACKGRCGDNTVCHEGTGMCTKSCNVHPCCTPSEACVDEGTVECVGVFDPFCKNKSWDAQCVAEAQATCNLEC